MKVNRIKRTRLLHSVLLAGACALSPALAGTALADLRTATPDPAREAAATRAKLLEEKCAKLACRTESRELRLQTKDGVAVMKTELLPYADAGAVVLYPGDAIEVDFAADGKAMGEPHFSRTVDRLDDPKSGPDGKPGPTAPRSDSRSNFWLEFQDNGTGMMLKLKSDLGFRVKYHAVMLVPERDGLRSFDTSSCPVIPYGSAYESWPHAIAMIVLTDFHVVASNDSACD
jgi:hypothetical protein